MNIDVSNDWMDLARHLKAARKSGVVDPRCQSRCLTMLDCVKLARYWNHLAIRERKRNDEHVHAKP